MLVHLYGLLISVSCCNMAGANWSRVGEFIDWGSVDKVVGNAEVVGALAKLKSYLDYGAFQPIQIAATVTLNEHSDFPEEVRQIYQSRRDALCEGLNRIGWEIDPPRGTMFAWAKIPEPYSELGSVEFASQLVQKASVAVSPGVGFGPGGEGHVRFALIENEQRIRQAVRNLDRYLSEI